MPCGDEMKSALSRYVDGELTAEERTRVDEHVGACEPCRSLLEIFRKNENLLANALAGEAFGDLVVDSVMRKIERTQGAPEARPVETGWLGRWRVKPGVSAAAAALLVAATALAWALVRRDGQFHSEVAAARTAAENARRQFEQTDAAYREQTQAILGRYEEYERYIRELRVKDAIAEAPMGTSLAYVEPAHYLRAIAKFDRKIYTAFDLYRRAEGESDYAKINAEPLSEPEFTDMSAKRGVGYYYRFRAFRSPAEYMDSAPTFLQLPAEVIPEQGIRIFCEETAMPRNMAVFVLEKRVSGKPVRERFNVFLGQTIGGVRNIPGVGEVDFRTGLELDKVEDGDQTLEISVTMPILDAQGRPAVDRIENNTFIPATTRHDLPVAVRAWTRAVLKSAEGSPAHGTLRLWKGSWMWVQPKL